MSEATWEALDDPAAGIIAGLEQVRDMVDVALQAWRRGEAVPVDARCESGDVSRWVRVREVGDDAR